MGWLSTPTCYGWKSGGISQLQKFPLRRRDLSSPCWSTSDRKRSPHNIWLWKTAGILSTQVRQKVARDCSCPLKGTAHKLSLIGTHPGLWRRDGGSEGVRIIQGETPLCGFRVRIGGTSSDTTVWSPPTACPTDAIFPGLSTPHTGHYFSKLH